jgi:putative exporter of polyketide antibiotics
MAALRRNNRQSRHEELNRLIWMGIVIAVTFIFVIAVATDMFKIIPLKRTNIVMLVLALLIVAVYVYSWIKFYKKRKQ